MKMHDLETIAGTVWSYTKLLGDDAASFLQEYGLFDEGEPVDDDEIAAFEGAEYVVLHEGADVGPFLVAVLRESGELESVNVYALEEDGGELVVIARYEETSVSRPSGLASPLLWVAVDGDASYTVEELADELYDALEAASAE